MMQARLYRSTPASRIVRQQLQISKAGPLQGAIEQQVHARAAPQVDLACLPANACPRLSKSIRFIAELDAIVRVRRTFHERSQAPVRIRIVAIATLEVKSPQRLERCTSGVQRSLPEFMRDGAPANHVRSEEHTSELQSQSNIVCRLLLE